MCASGAGRANRFGAAIPAASSSAGSWAKIPFCSRFSAGLDSELLHEHLPCLLVGLEGLCLPAGAVEGEHLLGAKTLPQRVFTDQHLQLAERVLVPPERKIAIDPIHQRRQPQLVELRHLVAPVRFEQQPGEGRAAPERECLA